MTYVLQVYIHIKLTVKYLLHIKQMVTYLLVFFHVAVQFCSQVTGALGQVGLAVVLPGTAFTLVSLFTSLPFLLSLLLTGNFLK